MTNEKRDLATDLAICEKAGQLNVNQLYEIVTVATPHAIRRAMEAEDWQRRAVEAIHPALTEYYSHESRKDCDCPDCEMLRALAALLKEVDRG